MHLHFAGKLFTSSTFGANKYNDKSTKASSNNSLDNLMQRLKVMNNRGFRGRGSQHRGRVARGRGQFHPANPSMTPKFEPESSKSPAESSIRAPLRRSFADVLEPAKLAPGDWSPLDDNIPIVLPDSSDKAPTRDEVHAYILRTIKDPYTKKRLPVFEKICQESEEQDFLERHTWEPPNPGQFSKKSLRRRGSN